MPFLSFLFVSLHTKACENMEMNKTKRWMIAAILTICGMTMVSCFSDTKKSTTVSATDDASQFVTITDVVPDAILEIRYFGTYNFVGTRIDGYDEPIALLTKQAADSLKAVSDDVIKLGYRLEIYDAIQRGVNIVGGTKTMVK